MEEKRWHQPPTSAIHLRDGRIVEAHVNGKSEDGKSGYVYVDGQERRVEWIDGNWYEQVEV